MICKRNVLANDHWKKMGLRPGSMAWDIYEAFVAGWNAAKKDKSRRKSKKKRSPCEADVRKAEK